jgi:spore coat protein CotH/DNA-directed RNA polymerase specialized sigma24 family protein
MSDVTPQTSDRDVLLAWRRAPKADSLQPIVHRYAALVYASAYRRTGGDDALAVEITRAVFLTFARRARKLSRKTIVADWLFGTTRLATRKARRSRWWPWRWFKRRKRTSTPDPSNVWNCVAPKFDRAIDRLPTRKRRAFLLLIVLGFEPAEAARILRIRQARARKRAEVVLKRFTKKWRKPGHVDAETFAREIREHACAPPSDDLATNICEEIAPTLSRRPRQKLARRVLTSLALKRLRRRIVLASACIVALAVCAATIAWRVDSRSGFSRLLTLYMESAVRLEAYTIKGLAAPAKPWPATPQTAALDATRIHTAEEIYNTTNIWTAHLSFSRKSWNEIQPRRIGPMPNFFQPDGSFLLRNPVASRSGLAGVLGFEFDWTHADFEFGGVHFTNVAARIKGNGSHLLSLYGDKRAFKVDLNKYVKGQKLAGEDEFTFNNLVVDRSYMADALGYEFFRDAGVPAPRTAFAYLSASIAGKWNRKPLGLYVMVEPVDAHFTADRFGSRKVPLFKPVTYRLFEDLGKDWSAYRDVYDAKAEPTPEQQRRIIDFARLVSNASDAEFALHVGEFLDLEEFAKFLAGQVLLVNYDGILFDGQNFYLYLDPKSGKFGFIPWDLDSSWGSFPVWSTQERERASIWHPWVGENKFLERVMAVEEFKKLYRSSLEDFLARLFVPERLFQRMDELAAVIRPAVAAESDFRLVRFEKALSNRWEEPPFLSGGWADRPVHQMKRFIEKRAHFVRQQLDGKSHGMILKRPPRGW